MAKQTIVLVHGMGSTTKETFEEEFRNASKAAFQFYDKLKDKEISDLVDIEVFPYNHIIEQKRDLMRDDSLSIRERLKSLDDGNDRFIDDESVSNIESVYDVFYNDGLFATHWLDVLFYRFTLLGEDIRSHLAEFICDVLVAQPDNGSRVHIVGHSLGSSLVHDTLAKLYTSDFEFRNFDKPPQLYTRSFKLSSIHMFANVSRVLESIIKVRESCVKPGQDGCTHKYIQYINNMDPITWPKRFNPKRSGSWIDDSLWQKKRYNNIKTSTITSGNPHSLSHYLLNPENSYPFFQTILPDARLKTRDFTQAMIEYDGVTLKNRTDKIEKHFDSLSIRDSSSIKELFTAFVELKNFLNGIGEDWDA